jgi:UDP-glucose 4-epimerase
MHYLITGGAGCIGSHLTERLLTAGARVTVLDDLSFGRRGNLAAVAGHPHFRFVRGSAASPRVVRPLVASVDSVVHLAATVGVTRVSEHALPSLLGNLGAGLTVLDAAARASRPVLLASSSEVYGMEARGARETDPVVLGPTQDPRWGYAAAKALDEWLALAHARERGLEVRIVRFFNVTGPRQRADGGSVLPRFVRQALRGKPLTVHGNGQQTRCFCHVRDAVRAVHELLLEPRARGEVVNIGSDREVSILALAQRVLAATGARAELALIPALEAEGRANDVRARVPDLTRLRDLIDFVPQFDLDHIIADVVNEQRARLTAARLARRRLGGEHGLSALDVDPGFRKPRERGA